MPQFESLLDLAVKESVLIFNNNLYKQVDGVAMGSPLGPTLGSVFLCYHEKTGLIAVQWNSSPLYTKDM